MTAPTDAADRALLLVVEVTRLQSRYCDALDRGDTAGLRAVFTDDAELLAADGSVVRGGDAIVAFFAAYRATGRAGMHLVTNVEVGAPGTVVDAVGAAPVEARSGFVAVAAAADGSGGATTWGRYDDHVARGTDGVLRLAAKRVRPWGRTPHPVQQLGG